MPTVTRLELKGLTRTFGATQALHDFTLEIEGGAFVTLLGPSGCGKTTALNCIAGLLDLTAGEIILNGTPIHHLSAEKRDFGMVFQNYALFPHLTVSHNVSYGLETTPMPKSERDRRVGWALDLVQLPESEFGKRYPAQLSGGQQQRLAIARTIVREPKVLLLDEPLSNLDARLRTEMRIEIKHLHQRLGLTTIYVTHDQAEAISLSDVVVVMRKGRIEQVGEPQVIYDCPLSLYVADFVGYANRLPVELIGRDGDAWTVRSDGGVTLQATSTVPDASNWQAGTRLLACCRPDDLLADPTSDVNRLHGIVDLVEYVGKVFEVLVRLGGQEEYRVLIHSQHRLELERPVEFGIQPDRLLLFPEDATYMAQRSPRRLASIQQ